MRLMVLPACLPACPAESPGASSQRVLIEELEAEGEAAAEPMDADTPVAMEE